MTKHFFSGETAPTIPKKRLFTHLTKNDKRTYSIQDYIKTGKRNDICRRDSPAYQEAAATLEIKTIIKEKENYHKALIFIKFYAVNKCF